MRNRKKLPIGIDSFEKIIRHNFYYVDKTEMITELLHNWGEVNLFTRPRRFGKSLNMNMLQSFLEIGCDKSLFNGLKVSREKELCEEYMGKFPVISLTLKNVEGLNFESARKSLKNTLGMEAWRLSALAESSRLTEEEKNSYKALTVVDDHGDFKMSDATMEKALLILTVLLEKHYGKKAVLLIDEYDVLMAKAGAKAYYNEMLDVIGTMMSQALKDNTALKFSVITGCLRISKESIFTGTNNFVADTIADERFSSFFGFTDEEVRKLLENTDNLEYFDQIKKWYDGYCFGKTEIYCPWDVLCYLNKLAFESESEPENFWENTSHNDIIRTFLSCEGMDVTDSFERLLAGETIEVNITENLTYENLTDSEENLWSVLYLTGYLTKDIKNPVSGKTKAFLKIPNAEIMDIFRKSVVRWFDERIAVRDRSELFEALWNEDAGRLSDLISELLFETISYHDYAESFYHTFLAGLFANAGYIVESNYESGLGRPDLVIKDKKKRRAVITEMKITDSVESMQKAEERALKQIEEMRYADGMYA